MKTWTLDGAWQFRRIGGDGWKPGQVPGTLLGDLLRLGEAEDPFYRNNEEKTLPLFDHDYEYRRSFALPEDAGAGRKLLRFEGLDTLAEVELNGRAVLNADNMFRTYELDVTGALVAGDNELRVVFRSPVAFMKGRNAVRPLFGIPMVVEGYTHLRKAHYMSGWDWGPKLPDCGIWRSVTLLAPEEARWSDVLIRQKHGVGGQKRGTGAVELQIGLHAEREPGGTAPLTARLTVADPDGAVVADKTVALVAAGHGDVALTVDQPRLWWPNGFGAQPLYRVTAELFGSDGKRLDSRAYTIGLRELTVNTAPDEWGSAFAFRVNGVDIFSMGADYIPEDNLLERHSRVRSEQLIRDCARANFNTIRVWGGGFYPADDFYDMCDKYGLLVWQDFMFACGVYPLGEAFNANSVAEIEDNVRRIRHHACLGLLCGNNEIEMFFEDGRIANTEENRSAYCGFFEERLPALVGELAPDTFYWPGSPSSGGDFFETNGENHGDGHYWDVWHGNKPFTAYRTTYYRYMSEFGFESMPDYRTTLSFTKPEDRNLFSYVMEMHQKNPAGNQKILTYLSETFRYPKDLRSLGYVSQLMQAEAMRYGVEHWRRHRGRCMGALYWQLNDCWPTLSWSSIDYYGRWKALHYLAKRFFAPLLLSACESDTGLTLHVTNETLRDAAGKVTWALRELNGAVLDSGEAAFRTAALRSDCVLELDFSARLADGETRRNAYVEYALRPDGAGAEATGSTGTVYFAPAKYLDLPAADIRADIAEEPDRFVLTLTSSALARFVELTFRTLDGIFSDNYFDLSAGAVKRVKLLKADLSRPVSLAELRADLQMGSLVDTY